MEKRTKDKPWKLKTPPLTSDYTMHVDTKDGKEILVCAVGTTALHYDYRAIKDLHDMLKKHGDWMELSEARMRNKRPRRHRRALGALIEKSHRRLVWTQKRIPRTIRHVYASINGSAGSCGSGT